MDAGGYVEIFECGDCYMIIASVTAKLDIQEGFTDPYLSSYTNFA